MHACQVNLLLLGKLSEFSYFFLEHYTRSKDLAKCSTLSPSDRSRASAFQIPSKVFGSTSGACSPRGVPTVKSVLSGFSEFYPDGIPAIAERGIEDLYQKYAEFSCSKIRKYI